jgi:hypothetical protein
MKGKEHFPLNEIIHILIKIQIVFTCMEITNDLTWLVCFEGELEFEFFWDMTVLLVKHFLTFDDHSAVILKGLFGLLGHDEGGTTVL